MTNSSLDLAGSTRSVRPGPFGIPWPVLVLFLVSFAVTAGIILFQIAQRTGGPGGGYSIFYQLFLMLDYPAAWMCMGILLLGLISEVQAAGATVNAAIAEHARLTVLVVACVLGLGAVGIYHAYPLCLDEYAPYFQAHAFAAGRLAGDFPADLVDWLVVPGFQGVFFATSHETGATISTYLPGFALVLAPFSMLGIPWLANPVIGAMSVVAVAKLTERLYGSREAGWFAGFLALASPALTLNAISFYSMSAHLICNVGFLLLLLKYTRTGFFAAGLLGSLALNLHNPVPHTLFALPFIVWLLTQRHRWPLLPWLFAGYLPGVVLIVAWRQFVATVAGDAGEGALNFGDTLADIGATLSGLLTSPGEAIVTARLIGLMKVWIWAVPALVTAAAYGFWLRRADVHLRLLITSAVLTLVGFLFVPFDQGHGWGFRYFHPAWFVLPVLAAGLVAGGPARDVRWQTRIGGPLVRYLQGTALLSLTLLTGFMAWQVSRFIGQHLSQLPQATGGEPRILMIDPTWGYYAWDLVQNDPLLRDPVIKMLTHGTEADEEMLAKHFPGVVKLGGDYRGTVYGKPATAVIPSRATD